MTTIDEVLPRVEAWRGREVTARELSGGLTNTNYLVDVGGDRYVLRIPGASTELLAVDRANERHNAAAAATTGVSPRIVEVLEDVDVMVIEFVDGVTMSAQSLRAPAQARRIAASLRRLHAGPRFRQDFDMVRLTEFYLDVCARHDVPVPDGFGTHREDVARIERALSARPLATVPCHNDLLAENYIDDGSQLWIVDFEYSGNNDPTFELGDTAQECAFDADQRATLCEAYFGEATLTLLARMELQAVMADVGWTLWAAIQAKISSIDFDFWGWAEERWRRATTSFGDAAFGGLLADAAR
ncbi:MAG TPA: choline/ethanolamine kinase family protein [Actinomycetota bacterium]|nr:choline/ethanolamine kinase family protein [Actinomycetota bacterium]